MSGAHWLHWLVSQSCPPCSTSPCPPRARAASAMDPMAHTLWRRCCAAHTACSPLGLLCRLVLPGLLVAHMAAYLGIHTCRSEKLMPWLGPKLPSEVESCFQKCWLFSEGSAHLSPPPPGDIMSLCARKKQHFPGQPSRFKLYLQPWQGKASLVHKPDLCLSSACSRRSELPNMFLSLFSVSIASLSTAPQHKRQHCAAQTLL